MITPHAISDYVKAKPFLPFRIHLASGREFDVRHPEMIKVAKSAVLIFKTTGDSLDFPDEWETVSLMLTESISYLENPVPHS